MVQTLRFRFRDSNSFYQARAIRHRVFVEEQGVSPELEYEHDEEAHHYLLMIGEKAIGTARWRETAKGLKLERFAILPGLRNRGFGEILLNEVLDDVIPLKKPVYLHSQARAVPFYARNGFVQVGEMFVEAGIEHYCMVFRKNWDTRSAEDTGNTENTE